jgi:hypothetical protein
MTGESENFQGLGGCLTGGSDTAELSPNLKPEHLPESFGSNICDLRAIAAEERQLLEVDDAVADAARSMLIDVAHFSHATGQADTERRIEADQELLQRLALRNFEGPDWEQFRTRLAKYGWAVIRAWCRSGKVFLHFRRVAFGGLPPPPRPIGRDDSNELAMETVALAMDYFREGVLIKKRWDPTRGATIATFFIGACIRNFGNVYMRWKNENAQLGMTGVPSDVFVQAGNSLPGDGLPGTSCFDARLELAEALTARPEADTDLRARVALGYRYEQIASALSTTTRNVERRIIKVRRAALSASMEREDGDA